MVGSATTEGSFFNVYASGIGIMLLGVALTVWLVDYLGRQREMRLMSILEAQVRQQEENQTARDEAVLKSQLIRELGSGDQGLDGAGHARVRRAWLADRRIAGRTPSWLGPTWPARRWHGLI